MLRNGNFSNADKSHINQAIGVRVTGNVHKIPGLCCPGTPVRQYFGHQLEETIVQNFTLTPVATLTWLGPEMADICLRATMLRATGAIKREVSMLVYIHENSQIGEKFSRGAEIEQLNKASLNKCTTIQ